MIEAAASKHRYNDQCDSEPSPVAFVLLLSAEMSQTSRVCLSVKICRRVELCIGWAQQSLVEQFLKDLQQYEMHKTTRQQSCVISCRVALRNPTKLQSDVDLQTFESM